VTRFLLALLLLHAALQIPSPTPTSTSPAYGFSRSPGAPQPAGNQSPAAPQTPGNATPSPVQPSGNASPAGGNATPGAPSALDPAAATFVTDAGIILVAVKPDKTADYEAVIVALQEALSKSDDEQTRALASGWRVFKATDLDAKANAIYIHFLQPAVAEADYRPSLWLDKLLAGAPLELLTKYRDAFAAPPTKLPLIEFADMSKAPVPKPGNATSDAPKPVNGSPGAPTKPGNGSPSGPHRR
jgi:hypothetical protein